jgi:hypothetical protein
MSGALAFSRPLQLFFASERLDLVPDHFSVRLEECIAQCLYFGWLVHRVFC